MAKGGGGKETYRTRVASMKKWSIDKSWQALGTGLNGTVLAIGVSRSEVYVGGLFTRASDVQTAQLARWNGAYASVSSAAQQRNVRQGVGLISFNFSMGLQCRIMQLFIGA